MDAENARGDTAANPLKRQRTQASRSTAGYSRKRAIQACQTCRLRKTKCNNERPTCGFCQSLGATCVYEDSKDISTLDPASLMIIERLDTILQKLDDKDVQPVQQLETPRSFGPTPGPHPSTFGPSPVSEFRGQALATPDTRVSFSTDPVDDLNLDVNMMTPPSRTSPDAVLDWPVFQKQFDWGHLSDPLFIHGFSDSDTSTSVVSQSFTASASIDEELVPKLVEIFLSRVHIKCPVLDIGIARQYAREVSQEGVRWTAPSCLVLVMSALGCLARPFSDLYSQTPSYGTDSSESLHSNSLATAKVYYDAACKRIAMLRPTILSTQCIYLCGVYQMYCMKPLLAWHWFSNASSTLFMYLKYQDAFTRQNPQTLSSPDIKRVEASLYWSVYKSMCEIRTELPVPASLLFEVEYPHVLPTPPANFADTMGFNDESAPLFVADSPTFSQIQSFETHTDRMQEQAWFFYLTDIILSRLGTRVLLNLFDTEHSGWDETKIYRLIRAADEFERQLEDWHQNLPEPIKFDDYDIRPNNELRFTVQARALEIKAWLYRPFLYYYIHQQCPPHISARVRRFAEKAIDSSIHWILLRPVRHRHHGSWFVSRLVLSSALSIVAAVKSGFKYDALKDWRDILSEAISAMEFWARESPDFEQGKKVLQDFYTNLTEPDQ